MKLIEIDRRQLLRLGLGTIGATTLPWKLAVAEDAVSYLSFNIPVGLRSPNIAGILTSAEFAPLSELAAWVFTRWQLVDEMGSLFHELRTALELKAIRAPSYFTEYREASALISVVRSQLQPDQAFSLLIGGVFPPNDGSRINRFRFYVSNEMLTLLVALGGFKRYGELRNYRGFQAGSWTDPDNPPYRGLLP